MQINIANKIILSSILLMAFFISCNNERERLTTSEFSGKYWDVYRIYKKEYKMTDYGYYFKSNGKCIYYFYTKSDTKNFERNKFDFGDVIYPESWSIKNDSTVRIMGIEYNVLKLSKNKIIMLNVLNKQDTVHLRLSNLEIKNSSW